MKSINFCLSIPRDCQVCEWITKLYWIWCIETGSKLVTANEQFNFGSFKFENDRLRSNCNWVVSLLRRNTRQNSCWGKKSCSIKFFWKSVLGSFASLRKSTCKKTSLNTVIIEFWCGPENEDKKRNHYIRKFRSYVMNTKKNK